MIQCCLTQQQSVRIHRAGRIQNEAARIVTGDTKLTLPKSLNMETGWESLASRSRKSKLVLFYKMQNGMTLYYLSFLAPPTVGCTTRYRLRNKSDFQTIPVKSQRYYKYFLPSVTRAWNRLSDGPRPVIVFP